MEEAVEGDGIHYWVPRVRLMFAAEDPEVFSRRIAYAYRARQVITPLHRFTGPRTCIVYTYVHTCLGYSVHLCTHMPGV